VAKKSRRASDAGSEASSGKLTAAERVEQRRAERSRGRSAAAASRRRQRRIRQLALIGVALIALAGTSVFAYQRITHEEPGRSVRDAGRTHIADDVTGTGYTSDPPTSGPHWASVASWGVHQEPVPNELQIHNLEHGGIMMQYGCEDCPEIIAELEALANSCNVKLITAPRPGMEHAVAVTAWNRILTMDEWDREQVVKFINAYADKGPERFPSETAAWNRCSIN
jgi:hypothetical protein